MSKFFIWSVRAILIIIFLIAFGFTSLTWYREVNTDYSNLELRPNSTALQLWANPPPMGVRVYFFNYTNIEAFQSGHDKKLKLQEVGPYVYIDNFQKVNIEYNESEHTLSYNTKVSSYLVPEFTNGNENDIIIIPDMVYANVLKKIKEQNLHLEQSLMNDLNATGATLFKTTDVKSLLWGYEDKLIEFIKTLPEDKFPDKLSPFGYFTQRNGTGSPRYVVYTGEDDIKKLNKYKNIDNETEMKIWSTEACNKIDGSDGSQFPPNEIDRKQKLKIFSPGLCRSLSFSYSEDKILPNGIEVLRYELPITTLAPSTINPENKCYCLNDTICPVRGLFNLTTCNRGIPIFLSFPHFYGGSKILHDKLDGLKPNYKNHMSFADIEPNLAVPVNGAVRFQINTEVHKVSSINGLDRFSDGDILPIIWSENRPGDIPQSFVDKVNRIKLSKKLNDFKKLLTTKSFLILVLTFSLLILTLFCRKL